MHQSNNVMPLSLSVHKIETADGWWWHRVSTGNGKQVTPPPLRLPSLTWVSLALRILCHAKCWGIRRRCFVMQGESECHCLHTHGSGATTCYICLLSYSLWMQRHSSALPKDLLISLPTSVLSMHKGIRLQKSAHCLLSATAPITTCQPPHPSNVPM